jgi:hypothetical protein
MLARDRIHLRYGIPASESGEEDMKKVLLVVVALVLLGTAAFADGRADIGIAVPWKLGTTLSDSIGDTEELNVLANFTFLVPQLFLGYEFELGPVNLGLGGRLYTLIFESVASPAAFAELELGPVALNLNVAGGGFLFFGLYNDFATAPLFLPDLSAHVRLGKSLHLGLGTTFIMHRDLPEGVRPYVLYLSGKFIVRF